MPNTFTTDRQLDSSFPPPLPEGELPEGELPEGDITAGQAQSWDADNVAQPLAGTVDQCAHQAAYAPTESPESADWSPVGCHGAVASPAPVHTIDGGEDEQDYDIAAEDWLDITHALLEEVSRSG